MTNAIHSDTSLAYKLMVLTQERDLGFTLQVQCSSPCVGALKLKKKKKTGYVRKSNSENIFVLM